MMVQGPMAKERLATARGLWCDAYGEMLRPRTVAVAVASVILFTVAMTIFGPLGTANLGLLARFSYWALCAGVTFPLCYAVAAVVLYLLRLGSLIEIASAVAAAVLFEGLVCTAVVLAADSQFLPERTPRLTWAITYLTVTIVVAVCTFFTHYVVFQRILHNRALSASGNADPVDPPDDAVAQFTPRQARFHDRLSRGVSRDIICLEMDDHYVNVHTTSGSCLVLMRFADAVADLGDLGMQVHRSHWVAHRHMVATVRRDGRPLLRVTDGRNVPISRPYLPAVRAVLSAQPSRPVGGDQNE